MKLPDVQQLKFANPVIESEFRRALDVLSLPMTAQKKAVSLHFAGDGKRKVQVGYVIEAPIWKTSYRLVLGEKEKPYLQGWAMVENPTDEDWAGVKMALISGRPICFKMDLYNPLYINRPVVEPELFASLRPVTYRGGFGKASSGFAAGSRVPRRGARRDGYRFTQPDTLRRSSGRFRWSWRSLAGAEPAAPAPMAKARWRSSRRP